MPHLPATTATPLIRTDFTDDDAWRALVEAIGRPSEEGFLANVHVLDQKDFAGMGATPLAGMAANHAILLIADEITMTHPDRPVLCVDVFAPERTFRVVPASLWSAENNLSLANLDFEDFTDAVGSDGIFRDF